MKRLVCEVCGSTDIKKEDNTYVCESCGCKYSIEEIKKLLVEGEITVNENHNYNISHEVSGQVELVTKDNTVEEINRIIRAFDRDWKNARAMLERAESWYHYYSLFDEGGFVLNYPNLPETWLSLLYLQTMAFTFDRETYNEICEQMPSEPMLEDEYEWAYLEISDNGVNGYCSYHHTFNDDNEDRMFASDSDHTTQDYRWKYDSLKHYCSTEEIFNHLKDISNNPNTTQEQKNMINEYKQRYDTLVANIKRKYASETTTRSSNNQNSYSQSSYTSQSSGGCYIATAVYGSYDCPEVWTLRRYRDRCLAQTWYGRIFIRIYYAISPTLVRLFGNTSWFKSIWRGKLDSMVKRLQSEGYMSTPYKDIE